MRRRIFVFGSNLKGIHGTGSAGYARDHYGAEMGVGEGLTGESYALPTCTGPGTPDTLINIGMAVDRFYLYARNHPEMDFLLTPVGTGIAGFKPEEIIMSSLEEEPPDNVYISGKLLRGVLSWLGRE